MSQDSKPSAGPLDTFDSLPDGPVDMFNQLRFHAQAQYPENSGESPCSGREAFARYAGLLAPLLAEFGGAVRVWQGRVHAELTRSSEPWDVMMVVRYPNAAAVKGLLLHPGFHAIHHHREAAIADSRTYICTPE